MPEAYTSGIDFFYKKRIVISDLWKLKINNS